MSFRCGKVWSSTGIFCFIHRLWISLWMVTTTDVVNRFLIMLREKSINGCPLKSASSLFPPKRVPWPDAMMIQPAFPYGWSRSTRKTSLWLRSSSRNGSFCFRTTMRSCLCFIKVRIACRYLQELLSRKPISSIVIHSEVVCRQECKNAVPFSSKHSGIASIWFLLWVGSGW